MEQYVLLDFSKLSYFLVGREFFYEFFDNLPSNLGLNYLQKEVAGHNEIPDSFDIIFERIVGPLTYIIIERVTYCTILAPRSTIPIVVSTERVKIVFNPSSMWAQFIDRFLYR